MSDINFPFMMTISGLVRLNRSDANNSVQPGLTDFLTVHYNDENNFVLLNPMFHEHCG